VTRALVVFMLLCARASAAMAAPAGGSPPSGAIAIAIAGKYVYAKSDRIVSARVLAPLIRGNTVLMPFRALIHFQGRLGEKPRVSYDAASRTVEISKPGGGAAVPPFDMKVRVGERYLVINGQRDPIDVAPEIYRGSIVVPVRAVAEALHAYIEWVPRRRLVVIGFRYVHKPIYAATIQTATPTAPPPSVHPSVPLVTSVAPPPPVTSSRLGFFNDSEKNHSVISPNDPRRYGRYSYVLLAKGDDRARSFVRSLLGAVVENPSQTVPLGAPVPNSPSEDTHRWNVFFIPVIANTQPIAMAQGDETVNAILGRYDFVKARDMLADYCDDVSYHAQRTVCSNTFTGPVVLTFLRPLPVTITAGSYPRAFAYDFGAAPPDQFAVTLTQIEGDIALATQIDQDAYLPPSLQVHIANAINVTMYTIAQIAPLVRSFTDYAFGRETAH
jgi:hypothetical protein